MGNRYLSMACAVLFICANVTGRTQGTPGPSYERDSMIVYPQVVSVNQSGYNLGFPKRFTAPLAADGDPFVVTRRDADMPLFKGQVRAGVGDFSTFNPMDTGDEFVIRLLAHRAQVVSYPFRIGKYWLENAFLRSALDFMIDDRSVTGTHPSAYGGCPWRDGTYYSFEVPSLVLQYLSNPAAYETLPIQIDYGKEKARVLAPDFKYVTELEGQTALAAARKYYTALDAPVGRKVPDIIQLIHWGIGYYMVNPVTLDPSSDPAGRCLHPQTLEQFAFFLYGYPLYKPYFTDAYYKMARNFALSHWEQAGLFDVFTTIGTGKGRECPGHSILPNLFMYEVARREGNADSSRFFQAAFRQTEWVISQVDWNDPLTTKGQRMSEHKLVPALVYFWLHYPEKAPAHLREKIEEWSDMAIARSNNYWDFRRYDLVANWSIPEFNETGNIAGLPASLFAAASIEDTLSKRVRLEQLAVAAFDDLFGRNPQNACAPYEYRLGFDGLKRGWPKGFDKNLCARLETVRGAISATCSTEMYPYSPDGQYRHLEGWTAFNAAWDAGLAYLTWYDTDLTLTDKTYRQTVSGVGTGGTAYIRLSVPSPGDAPGTRNAWILRQGRKPERLVLKATGKGSQLFTGAFPLKDADGARALSVRYGDGPFTREIHLIK